MVRRSLAVAMLAAVGSFAAMCGALAESYAPALLAPVASEAPARLHVDAPLPDQLAEGRVVIRYRPENVRILPVYGPAALDVSPRIGHLHVTVDDGPWRWVDASGEPLIINKLPAGPHKILIELADPTHKVIASETVDLVIPQLDAAHH
jgi:Family of unknown function (DUF6130)